VKLLTWAAIIIVVASILGGLFIAGSPGDMRKRQYDTRRAADLAEICSAVDAYFQEKDRLPAGYTELNAPGSPHPVNSTADPLSGAPYQYSVSDSNTYVLCATFETDTRHGANRPGGPTRVQTAGPLRGRFENHAATRACFTLHPSPSQASKSREH
jgi:hypothetical protein